jgi:hypothetical protein
LIKFLEIYISLSDLTVIADESGLLFFFFGIVHHHFGIKGVIKLFEVFVLSYKKLDDLSKL